jgi:amino acid transporter
MSTDVTKMMQMWGTAMYQAGSMSVIWGWFITTFFTIIVAMSLAEICSAYPTTGGLYFWVSRLATAEWVPLACWVTGWANWMGLACKSYSAITEFSRINGEQKLILSTIFF